MNINNIVITGNVFGDTSGMKALNIEGSSFSALVTGNYFFGDISASPATDGIYFLNGNNVVFNDNFVDIAVGGANRHVQFSSIDNVIMIGNIVLGLGATRHSAAGGNIVKAIVMGNYLEEGWNFITLTDGILMGNIHDGASSTFTGSGTILTSGATWNI
jgi:hypothetical protein